MKWRGVLCVAAGIFGGEGFADGLTDARAEDASQPSIAPLVGPLGDPGGLRSALADKGISYNVTYIGELWGVASGGLKRRGTYDGRLELSLDADLGKLAGIDGLAFHADAFNIQGKGLSGHSVGNLLTVSNIEATPSTRMYELWLEQAFLGDRLFLRAGQLAADTEFAASDNAGLFVNGTFGWPGLMGTDLPGGGPAYPFGTPGVRLKARPTDELTLLFAAFNGKPAGDCYKDNPQHCNRYGTWHVSQGAFLMAEAAYAYNQGEGAAGLPGTVKIGAWYDSESFDSPRYARGGGLLADPDSSGIARRYRGNHGVYGIIDQTLYQAESGGTIGVFGRIAAAPGNRNTVSFYVDGGVSFTGFVPGRPDDSFGVAVAYAQISDHVRGFDRDSAVFNDAFTPVRDYEAVLEVTYKAQIVPGWTVQPDVQYVFHPGGKVLDPHDPTGTRLVKDAFVVGLRTTIVY